MRLLTAAAALLLATRAWAGLPVAYDADYKILKGCVSLGDLGLSFPLPAPLYVAPGTP